ncbi:hypothetical protein BGZ94_002069 [Podila epigama]|nr:hypothetical protein BGZ94_002069 [Podila epigama]
MSSTPSQASQLWEAFRQDPAGDHYLADSHIVFLPTGAGAAGEKYVRDFYRTGGFSHPKQLNVEEQVIHRTVGESSAVDEVEVTVKFVSGSGGWLLPGIAPHHLEDISITFALVICASFVENRIASVRYVWDNASVLKMVRLIGSRQSWPIVAETQVDALRNPSRFRLNPFGNPTSTSATTRPAQTGISNIFGATPPVSPFSSTGSPSTFASPSNTPAVAKKGHPALTSTVFSHLKNPPATHGQPPLGPSSSDEKLSDTLVSPTGQTSPTKKGHPALTSTLFNHLKNEPLDDAYTRERVQSAGNDDAGSQRQAMSEAPVPQTKKGHPALTSTLFNHLKEQPQQEKQQTQTQQQGPTKKGHPALTSTLFNHLKTVPQEQHEKTKEETPVEKTVSSTHQVDSVDQVAGRRRDYVKPKGHPALTSTIFSPRESAPVPTVTRPYKKTSHNIFGNPEESESNKIGTQAQPIVQKEASGFVLEPSSIKDDYDVEQGKASTQDTKVEREASDEDISGVLPMDKMSISGSRIEHDVVNTSFVQKAQETLQSPPQSPPPGRRMHPNYRSQISFG